MSKIYSELRRLAASIAEEAGTGPLARIKESMLITEKLGYIEKLIDNAEKESTALGLRWSPEEDFFANKVQTEIPTLSHEPSLDVQATAHHVNHALIMGDNLLGLISLLPAYRGKAKCIIIDPPYKSDNDEWVFRDKFSHSFWLTLLCARLVIAKMLLRRDGVVHIHIDEREMAHLKLLMVSLFTEDAYIATNIWKKKAGGGNDSGAIVADHEYILSSGVSAVEKPRLYLDRMAVVGNNYPLEDENGKYTTVRLDVLGVKYSAGLDFPIEGPDGLIYKPEVRADGTRSCWRWSESTVAAYKEDLVFKNGKVYTKNYEKDAYKPRTLLTDDRFGRTATGKGDLKRILGPGKFPYPKPVELVKHFIRISTAEDDIIIDFFAGSGTTAQAVAEVNLEDGGQRKAVLITDAGLASEEGPSAAATDKQKARAVHIARDITHERIRRVLTGEDWADGKEHPNLDQGLQVFTLGTAPATAPRVLGFTEDGPILSDEEELVPHDALAEAQGDTIKAAALLAYSAVIVSETPEYVLGASTDGRAIIIPRDHDALDEDSTSLDEALRFSDAQSAVIVTATPGERYEWMTLLSVACEVDALGARVVSEWHSAKKVIRSTT